MDLFKIYLLPPDASTIPPNPNKLNLIIFAKRKAFSALALVFQVLPPMSYNVPRIHELPQGVVRSSSFSEISSADRGPAGPMRECGVKRSNRLLWINPQSDFIAFTFAFNPLLICSLICSSPAPTLTAYRSLWFSSALMWWKPVIYAEISSIENDKLILVFYSILIVENQERVDLPCLLFNSTLPQNRYYEFHPHLMLLELGM